MFNFIFNSKRCLVLGLLHQPWISGCRYVLPIFRVPSKSALVSLLRVLLFAEITLLNSCSNRYVLPNSAIIIRARCLSTGNVLLVKLNYHNFSKLGFPRLMRTVNAKALLLACKSSFELISWFPPKSDTRSGLNRLTCRQRWKMCIITLFELSHPQTKHHLKCADSLNSFLTNWF